MTLRTPDMDEKTIKLRCLTGVNKGRAYDSVTPCLPNQKFNQIDCDCEDEYPWTEKRKWTYEVWEAKQWDDLFTVNPANCSPLSLQVPAGTSYTLLDSDTIENVSGVRVVQRLTVVDPGTCCTTPPGNLSILTGILQYRESFPEVIGGSLVPGGPVSGGEWINIKSYTEDVKSCDCCERRLGQQKTWIYVKLWVDDVLFYDGQGAPLPPEFSPI